MKKFVFVSCALTMVLTGFHTMAQAPESTETSDSPTKVVLAPRLMLGAATAIVNEEDALLELDPKSRFTGGGEFAFNLYLSSSVAINLGMGIISKGYRLDETISLYGYSAEIKARVNYLHLEMPVGVLFDLSGFRIGIDMVISFALHGRMKAESDGESYEEDVEDWDGWRRLNFCPRIFLGYGIPAGPVKVVPGAFWEMDLLNFYDDDIYGDSSYRHMNIMGTLGIEFGM